MLNRYGLAITTSILLALTGCSSSLKPGYVQKEWSNNLRQLGIVPVFPPREDFVVGDVYAYSDDPEDVGTLDLFNADFDDLTSTQKKQRLALGMSSRLDRIDLQQVISDEYKRTLSAPPTTADYNKILGNPALAAANAQLENSSAVLKGLKEKVQKEKKAADDAEKALNSARRAKDEADIGVTEAQSKLDAAKATVINTSVQDSELAVLKASLRDKEDAVLIAERAVEDAGNDEAKKALAQTALTTEERQKEDVEIKIRRLNTKKSDIISAGTDVTSEESALLQAKQLQQQAEIELATATLEKKYADDEAARIDKENQPKIASATTKVEQDKTVRDAIAKAGAQMLYAQPQYPTYNVYLGSDLSDDNAAKAAGGSRLNRLRLVGFPEFASTSISKGDLSALIPAEALKLNISSSNIEKVVVKVPSAESYGVSFKSLFDEIITTDISKGKNYYTFKKDNTKDYEKLISAAKLFTGVDGQSGKIYLRFITEVYYARAIDVSIFTANSFGTLLEVNKDNDTSDDLQFQGPIKSAAPGDASSTELLSAIQSNLGQTQAVPGGAVQLLNYSDHSVGLRRVYDRPIAIGFRGVTIEYNFCLTGDENSGNCEGGISGSVATNTAIPSVTPSSTK